MVSLLKHLSVSKKTVINRSKINEKQFVAIIIAELSDKSIHKSAIVYTNAVGLLVTLLVVNSNVAVASHTVSCEQ